MRRQTHEAGYSWRKWTEPLMYGKVGPDWDRRTRVVLFWAVCINVGALIALAVTR